MSAPTTPDPERKKGPWANRVLSSEVEHTPEYEEFMDKLARYHEKRGTVLIREPELGRKLLDLRKLYITVTGLGGYDKVTETKGQWRDIANTYRPPVNNSNAGYILKTIYYKNLVAYEISNFFHKEPPPKEWLEDRSAAGGAIMTRTKEEFIAMGQSGSPKASQNGDSASPPPTSERRSLRQQPTPRQFYAHETTPSRQNPPRSASQQRQQQQHQQQNPATNGSGAAHTTHVVGNASLFPDFRPGSNTFPSTVPVPTPRTDERSFLPPRKRKLPEIYGVPPEPLPAPGAKPFGTGHVGSNLMNRIVMTLKSGIQPEIEWARPELVRISFEAGDELRADHWPALGEVLFGLVRSAVQLIRDHVTEDNVNHADYSKQLEALNEMVLILRNMSLLPDNARRFVRLYDPMDILVDGLCLPNNPYLKELKMYLLDMVESMANDLPYAGSEQLMEIVVDGLRSDDRGVLLGSMRAICRMIIGRDDFNRLGQIPFETITRITSLLMLEDDELVSACLDFLYQYTSNEDNIEKLLAPPEGFELVRQLVRLLLFQGITGEQLVYIKVVKKAPPPVFNIPQLPEQIVNDLLTHAEPERATKWMRCCFEEDPNADITQIALWQAYQARFNEYVSQGIPLLPAAEFIKNVSVAFQTASAMVLPTTQGQKFIIKGIRARETPMDVKGNIYVACKWLNTPGSAATRCTASLATPQDLWAHVLAVHLPPPADGSSQPLFCNWAGCSRFGTEGELNRLKVVLHCRTHMPQTSKPRVTSREEQEMMEDPEARVIIKRCQTMTDERGDAGGIPLTSVLVLRNIKARGGKRANELILDFGEQLFEVMAVNKPLALYVSDLLII